MGDSIEIVRNGHLLEITLNRPKVNAIGFKMSQELGEAFELLEKDPELRVGIITGAGDRIFSAGWDLKEVNSGEASLENWWETEEFGKGGFAGITENWTLNKPVIGALNGMVIGGGFEIAVGCDLLIAAEHASFALPENAARDCARCRRIAKIAADDSQKYRDGNVAFRALYGCEGSGALWFGQ